MNELPALKYSMVEPNGPRSALIHLTVLLVLAAFLGALLPTQEPPLAAATTVLDSVDPLSIPSSFRSIKIVDSVVQNESGEDIGTIEALILSPSDVAEFAILSVGGFLGLSQKFVIVHWSTLMSAAGKTILLGGTREALMKLPSYPNAS